MQRREGAEAHRIASDSAEKLFLVEDIGVATYGIATIGNRSIRGLMEDFAPDAPTDLQAFAESLGEFFHAALDDATPSRRGDLRVEDLGWPLGLVVAGYDSAGVGHILDVKIRASGSRVEPAVPTTCNPGVAPRGQCDAIERTLEGVDLKRLDAAKISLSDEARERLPMLRYDLILPTTIEDAARLAEILVRLQIDIQSFSDGTYGQPSAVPGCGGVVRTLAVSRIEAGWVSEPGRRLPTSSRADAARGQAHEAREPAQRSA